MDEYNFDFDPIENNNNNFYSTIIFVLIIIFISLIIIYFVFMKKKIQTKQITTETTTTGTPTTDTITTIEASTTETTTTGTPTTDTITTIEASTTETPTTEVVEKDVARKKTQTKAVEKAAIKAKPKEKCNYKYHCLNKCKKSKGKLWCYLNKKSKNICRIDGNNKGPYAKKDGSKWSYQPCKNFVYKSIKKNKKKHTQRSCKCKIPWPCYDSKTKQCLGSGNYKDYSNNNAIIKYCNNINLNICIDNKILK